MLVLLFSNLLPPMPQFVLVIVLVHMHPERIVMVGKLVQHRLLILHYIHQVTLMFQLEQQHLAQPLQQYIQLLGIAAVVCAINQL